MVDPLSIVASCAGITTACLQCADIIGKFIASVKNVDENVRDFQREVLSLVSITDAVKLQLEKPEMASAMKATGAAKEGDANIWNCISRTLQDCEDTTQKLKLRLRTLDSESGSLLRPVLMAFKLNSLGPDINVVRGQIQSYHGTLSLALHMTSLSIQIQDREVNQQGTADLLASLNSLTKQIGKLEKGLEVSRGMMDSGDTTLSRSSTEVNTEVNEENLKVLTNMFETVKTAEAFVSSASVTLATSMRSTILGNSEYGVTLSEERRADIDRWVPSPLGATSSVNTAEAAMPSSDEQSLLPRLSTLQTARSFEDARTRLTLNLSTSATSDSNHDSYHQSLGLIDDDVNSDLDLMTRLFRQGRQSHLQGDEQMAAVSFRQGFEHMSMIKPQSGQSIAMEDSTLNLAFLTLDHHIWEVRLHDFEPLMVGNMLSAPHRSRAKHLVAHHLLRSGKFSEAETFAKSAKRQWEKTLAVTPSSPTPQIPTVSTRRGAKYPAIFKRGYEDVHRHIQPAYTEHAADAEFEAQRFDSSGFVRNFSCDMYATEDTPVSDNLPYLRWAYYDTLSLLVRILMAKGKSAEASVWLEDIPHDFYRPGEFDFMKTCDTIEWLLCAGDKQGAERVGLSHLRGMLGKFELSAEQTQSISAQIRDSEGRGFAGFHDGYTALHALGARGRLSSIRILLNKGCNPRPRGVVETPFLLAACNSHYLPARLFGDYKNGIRGEDAKKGLAYAIHNRGAGACDFAEYLLSRFDIVNATSYHEETKSDMPPLHRAICQSNIEMVNLLLKQPGIDVSQPSPGPGEIPLWLAARRGQIPVVSQLLERDQKNGTQGPQETTPLMAAIYAHAVTIRNPRQAPQVDPLNSHSVDLLKQAEKLLAVDAVKTVTADNKIASDWETIQEALRYLADHRPKENPTVREAVRILLGAYNMQNISDEELKDIIQRTKKFKSLENLGRRSSSTSLKNPFRRRASKPRALQPTSQPEASQAIDPPLSPQTRVPSKPGPARGRSIPDQALKSAFVQKYLGTDEEEEPMQIVHG